MITKGRDDYRAMTTKELIEEVQRGVNVNWPEIAHVLMERLYDTERDKWSGTVLCSECGDRV